MRIDLYLFKFGYSRSRESASRAIASGLVSVDGRVIKKPSEAIDENTEHTVLFEESIPYVGRGGLKLEGALDAFAVDVDSRVCIDIGASTGGFTDCLLRRGASFVYAVDSGHGQLARELREDGRVRSLEGMNARYLSIDDIGERASVVVMDVSFISQTLIIPNIPQLLLDDGKLVTLIKPQFECNREAIGKGGIVKKPEHRRNAVRRVVVAAADVGLHLCGIVRSPVVGGDGNIEYLALFEKEARVSPEQLLAQIDYSK
jgi:23S rRNA (cytidine1920-2'-O)/16S rRNA (cytidine1409-2'-O)-methyltransferase